MKSAFTIVFVIVFLAVAGVLFTFAYYDNNKDRGLLVSDTQEYTVESYDSNGNPVYGVGSRTISAIIYSDNMDSLTGAKMSMDIYDNGNLVNSPVADSRYYEVSALKVREDRFKVTLPFSKSYLANWKLSMDGEDFSVAEKFSMLPATMLPQSFSIESADYDSNGNVVLKWSPPPEGNLTKVYVNTKKGYDNESYSRYVIGVGCACELALQLSRDRYDSDSVYIFLISADGYQDLCRSQEVEVMLPGETSLQNTENPLNEEIPASEKPVEPDLSDYSLASITMGDLPLKDFSPEKYTYEWLLPESYNTIPAVIPTAISIYSSLNIDYPPAIPGTVSITVFDKSGTHRKVYNIRIERPAASNDNNQPAKADNDNQPITPEATPSVDATDIPAENEAAPVSSVNDENQKPAGSGLANRALVYFIVLGSSIIVNIVLIILLMSLRKKQRKCNTIETGVLEIKTDLAESDKETPDRNF